MAGEADKKSAAAEAWSHAVTTSEGERQRGRSGRSASGSGAVGRWFAKDPLSTGLIVASLVLVFSLLPPARADPAEHQRRSRFRSARSSSSPTTMQITEATLLDQDARVLMETKNGTLLYASYPESDAQTSSLVRRLTASGAIVEVDQQWDKPAKQIVVQFLIPILLLVCLFVLFTRLGEDGGAGAFAGFSKFTGKGRKRGADAPDRTTFDDVAGAGEAVAELREIRDYLADPGKYAAVGARAPKGVLSGRPAGHRKDPAREGDRRRGRGDLLLALGVRLRRVPGRGRRGEGPGPVREGAQDGAGARLHRRARRRRAQARRRGRPGQRRARADAQRAAGRDGRVRRRRRNRRARGDQPPGHPRPRPAAAGSVRSPGDRRRPRRPRTDGHPRPPLREPAAGARDRRSRRSPNSRPASAAPSSPT